MNAKHHDKAFKEFYGHISGCRLCYAPNNRYCEEGNCLKMAYDQSWNCWQHILRMIQLPSKERRQQYLRDTVPEDLREDIIAELKSRYIKQEVAL